MRYKIAWVLFMVLLLTTLPGLTSLAQGEITNLSAAYQFGKNIQFSADLFTTQPLQYALIYYQAENDPRTEVKPAEVATQDYRNYQLSYLLDLDQAPMRAFTRISYYFEVTLQSGEIITSEIAEVTYLDDRFPWQSRADGPFRVFWYSGDVVFAQQVLDVARAGYSRIQSLIPVVDPKPVDIYVYSNAQEMQETLDLAGRNWVAGHADPDLGVVVISLPPGPEQQLLTEQRVPHELMHIILYQTLGESYSNLPTWLNEGLPSLAELVPNPDYPAILDNAYQKGRLLPIPGLCRGFPGDASGALLAYAQAASFTSYLHNTYGAIKLRALVDEYASGVDCERGAQNILGASLTRLENQWRQQRFNENVTQNGILKLLPWFLLLLAVLALPILVMLGWSRRSNKPAPGSPAERGGENG
jgi:hypothetical protein